MIHAGEPAVCSLVTLVAAEVKEKEAAKEHDETKATPYKDKDVNCARPLAYASALS